MLELCNAIRRSYPDVALCEIGFSLKKKSKVFSIVLFAVVLQFLKSLEIIPFSRSYTIYRLFQLLIVGETFTMLTFVSAKSGTESGCNELPRIPQSTLRHDSATRIRRWVYLCRKRKGEKEREKRSGVRSNEANARVFSRCSDQVCNGNATRISRCSQGQQRECMSPGCERQIFPGPESEDQAFRIVSLMPRNLFTATSLRFWTSKASG